MARSDLTKIAVPSAIRIYGHAPPATVRVSPSAVASLSLAIEADVQRRDSWRSVLARRPDLAERLEKASSRRRA